MSAKVASNASNHLDKTEKMYGSKLNLQLEDRVLRNKIDHHKQNKAY